MSERTDHLAQVLIAVAYALLGALVALALAGCMTSSGGGVGNPVQDSGISRSCTATIGDAVGEYRACWEGLDDSSWAFHDAICLDLGDAIGVSPPYVCLTHCDVVGSPCDPDELFERVSP